MGSENITAPENRSESSPHGHPIAQTVNAPIPFWRRTIPLFGRIFNLLLQSTALFTVAGFFVVHTYLSSITNIYTYEVNLSVYISAGISVISLTFVAVLAASITNWQGLIIGIIIVLAFVVYIFTTRNLEKRRQRKSRVERAGRWSESVTFFLVFGVTIYFSVVYGGFLYSLIPRALGGGQSESVLIVFKPPFELSSLGLPITMSAIYPLQTEPVDLVMELRNGLLLRDNTIGIPFIVRNDVILAVIDAQPPPLVTVSTQSTLTATPAVSPTATP